MSSIGSFEGKVFSYISNNDTLAKINEVPLWKVYEKPFPEAENYAKKIINSKVNTPTLGDIALLLYGQLSGDSPQITSLPDNYGKTRTFELVSTPFEYYFTDMVFIQEKYEEAIIDLYTYRVYSFYANNDKHQELLVKIDKAIDDTCLLAQENGLNVNKDEVFAKFVKKIEDLIYSFSVDIKFSFNRKSYFLLDNFIGEAMEEFYLNPSPQTYQGVFDAIQLCVEKTCTSEIKSRYSNNFELQFSTDIKDAYWGAVGFMVDIINSKIEKHQIFSNLP